MDQEDLALSQQFLEQLRQLHHFDVIVGMHPLQAPGTFASAWLDTKDKEGWTDETPPTAALVLLPVHSKTQTQATLTWLGEDPNRKWRILAPAKIKDSQALQWLTTHATQVYQFPKGTRLLSCRNAWKQATY